MTGVFGEEIGERVKRMTFKLVIDLEYEDQVPELSFKTSLHDKNVFVQPKLPPYKSPIRQKSPAVINENITFEFPKPPTLSPETAEKVNNEPAEKPEEKREITVADVIKEKGFFRILKVFVRI